MEQGRSGPPVEGALTLDLLLQDVPSIPIAHPDGVDGYFTAIGRNESNVNPAAAMLVGMTS